MLHKLLVPAGYNSHRIGKNTELLPVLKYLNIMT
jgi:hypothetical protein